MSTEISDIVKNLADHPISLYIHVSGPALLVVDWLFTLDVEITHAWKGAWNFGRILFFVTRYSPVLDIIVMLNYKTGFSIPPPRCARLFIIWGSLSMFGILVAELIMTIRVWALWGRRRDIGTLLLIVGVGGAIASLVTYTLFAQPHRYIMTPIIPGCFSIAMGSTNSWSYIPIVINQTLIFALTAIKAIEHYRNGVYSTSLVNTFYRDGITYYALLVAFSIANLAAVIQRSDKTSPYFLTFLQRIIHSILSARMLLHLRQQSETFNDSKPLTSLRFGAVERPGDPSSMLSTQNLEEQDIPNDGWFGEEETPSRHSQSVGHRPVEA